MYIVGWTEGIVKVGCTANGRTRWGKFLSRGAVLLDLAYFSGVDDMNAELWLQKQLGERYPQAFESKAESLPYLGDGCGYLECYRIPVSEWPALVQLARS
jgi:hypothetical protein